MRKAKMSLPAVGTPAPDFELEAVDGGTVRLADAPKPVVLVFLRHLAWLYWAEHLVQLHRPPILEAFRRVGAGLLVVSFADLANLKTWVPWWRDTFMGGDQAVLERTRFVADPGRVAYEAYGLGRHSARKVYSARIMMQYMKWAAAGKPVRKTDEDKLQRGGDFVIGTNGRVLFSHTGRDQSERPPVSGILASIRPEM